MIDESVDAALRQGLSPYRQEQADGGVPRQTVARWVRQFAAQAPAHLLHSVPALGLPATGAAAVEPAATRQTAVEVTRRCADGARAPATAGGPEQESGGPGLSASVCAESAAGQPAMGGESGTGQAGAATAGTGTPGGLAQRVWRQFLAWGKREGRFRSKDRGPGCLLELLQPALSGLRPAVGVFRIPLNRACRGPPA